MDDCLLSVADGRLIGVLIGLLALSTAYALLLEWLERRWGVVSAYTWFAAVVGVAYTLIGVALLDGRAALLSLIAFAVGSLPLIARSLINDIRARKALRDYLEQRGNTHYADRLDRE